MNVIMTPAVEIAIRTLGEEDRRRVWAWFDHLRNWENDSFVRDHSKTLPTASDVRVLKTTNDIRIFFKLEHDHIEILDIATKAAILSSGSIAGSDA
jgi:hypothetical protein